MQDCSLGSDGVVTVGEGSDCPYLWNASSYGYAARTLGHYVRDVGLFELEDAVRRLTALPAEAMGLRDRGRLAPGLAADIVVFDPDRVADRTTADDMARHPVGIEHVLVRGVAVVAGGEGTGACPGRAVRA
jgi:N-acyl-D-amino-acid deacylase